MKDDYVRVISEFVNKYGRAADKAVFTGRVTNRIGQFCRCHDVEHASGGFGMGCYPICAVTKEELGPEDIYEVKLPDLVWSDAEQKMVEEKA